MEALRNISPEVLLKAVNHALDNPEKQLLVQSGGKRSVLLYIQGKPHVVSVGQIVDRVGELKAWPHGQTIVNLTGRVALLDMELDRKLAVKSKASHSINRILRKLGLKSSHLHDLLKIRQEVGPEKEHLFKIVKRETPHKLKTLEQALDSKKAPTVEMMQNLAEEILRSDYSREAIVSFCHQFEVVHQDKASHLISQLDPDVAREVAALSAPLRKAYVRQGKKKDRVQAGVFAEKLRDALTMKQNFPHHLTEGQMKDLTTALEGFAKTGEWNKDLFKAHVNPHFSSGLQAWVNSKEGKEIAPLGEEILDFIRNRNYS